MLSKRETLAALRAIHGDRAAAEAVLIQFLLTIGHGEIVKAWTAAGERSPVASSEDGKA